MSIDEKYLTVKEVAVKLQVTTKTIYNYIYGEKIQSYKFGRNIRIKETELIEFVENSLRK